MAPRVSLRRTIFSTTYSSCQSAAPFWTSKAARVIAGQYHARRLSWLRRKHCGKRFPDGLVGHEKARKGHQVRPRDHSARAEREGRGVAALARDLDRLVLVDAKRPREERRCLANTLFEHRSRTTELPGRERAVRISAEPAMFNLEVRVPVRVRLDGEQPGALKLGDMLPRECVRRVGSCGRIE